ncbi:MAG TPA: hypothetical protein VGL38_08550 [bacterium]|jgi:hypothetical protein
MASKTLHLKLTHRAHMAQHRSHLAPALMLIILGMGELVQGEQEHLALNLLGIAAGLALMILFKREASRKGAHSHSRVAWYDVVAGVVIMMEGVHKLHGHKWWQPGTLTMAAGFVVMLAGILQQKLPKLRRLRVTDHGFSLRTRPISSLAMAWSDVESIELKDNRLTVHRKGGGERRISLKRIENRAEALQMLQESLAERKGMVTA